MRMTAAVRSLGLLAWLLLLGTTPARPQAAPQPRKLGPLEVTFSLRLRAEAWDWFDTSAADGTYGFGASLLRVGIGQKRPRFDWQLELAQPFLLDLPDDAIAPAPQGQLGLGATYFAANQLQQYPAGVFLKQGYVRFKGLGSEANSLRLGRFEYVDGAETAPKDATLAALKRDRIAHRLLGTFGFSHVGRSFDGAQFVRDTPGSNLTFMAGRATEGVFRVKGMSELDVDVAYLAYTRPIRRGPGEWRLFALHYHDGRGALKTDNRPLALRTADHENIRLGTFGGNLLQTFKAGGGTADFLLWGTVQTGRWGQLSHSAGAVAVEGGYQPNFPKLRPWLRAGYFYGSGDGNALDGEHHTFFQALPTPRIYARFPFYNLMNNQDAFLELILRPHKRLSLRSDLHTLRLSNGGDLWYQGGGAYDQNTFGYAGRPSGGRRSLATVFDVSADVQVSTQTSLTFHFANASGKRVISNIYPQGRDGRFGYVEFLWKF